MRSNILFFAALAMWGPGSTISSALPSPSIKDSPRRLIKSAADIPNLPEGFSFDTKQMPRGNSTSRSSTKDSRIQALDKREAVTECLLPVSITSMSFTHMQLIKFGSQKQLQGILPLQDDCQEVVQQILALQASVLIPGQGTCHQIPYGTCIAAICNVGCEDTSEDSDVWAAVEGALISQCLVAEGLVGNAYDNTNADLLYVLEYSGDELPAYQDGVCS